MSTIDKAAATLRVRQLSQAEENEALELVLTELYRYRTALKFYADAKNYLDGTPMLKSAESGLLEKDDEGFTARAALRLDDYVIGRPFTRAMLAPEPAKEEGNDGEPSSSVS